MLLEGGVLLSSQQIIVVYIPAEGDEEYGALGGPTIVQVAIATSS